MTSSLARRERRQQARIVSIGSHAARLDIKRKSGHMKEYPYDERTTELLAMLRTKRPAGSATEQHFVEQWIEPLGTTADGFGNHWLTIGEGSRILWSCHTDTVHRDHGVQYVGFQDGCAYVTASNCLGADDTTGVWLMRNMILARVPGTYVFHREEECGAVGSNWIRDNTPDRLREFDHAIAFDRKGYEDIVTDQCGETASETFAYSLASCLEPLIYGPADGVFTDTQVYSDVIPECSNISVGYHAMHTTGEWQDVDFAMRLLDVMVSADFTTLDASRDPTLLMEYPRWWQQEKLYEPTWKRDADIDAGLWDDRSPRSMDDFVRQYPQVVSDFLNECGYDLDELRRYAGMTV